MLVNASYIMTIKKIYGLWVGMLIIFKIISKLYKEGVMMYVTPRALIWHDSRCILSQLSKIYLVYGWGSQPFSRLTPTCIMQGVGMTTVALVWHVNQCTLSCPLTHSAPIPSTDGLHMYHSLANPVSRRDVYSALSGRSRLQTAST